MTETEGLFVLIDGLAEHARHERTFEAVSPDEIARLRPGWFVKIGVRFDPNRRIGDDPPIRAAFEAHFAVPAQSNYVGGERFWLELTAIDAAGFHGRINNDLVYTAHHGLRCDDPLTVERRHLLDTMAPTPR